MGGRPRPTPLGGGRTAGKDVAVPKNLYRGEFRTGTLARLAGAEPERMEVSVSGSWALTLTDIGAHLTGHVRLTEPRPDDLEHPTHRFDLELPDDEWLLTNGGAFANSAAAGEIRLDLLATLDSKRDELTLYADVTGSPFGWDWWETR